MEKKDLVVGKKYVYRGEVFTFVEFCEITGSPQFRADYKTTKRYATFGDGLIGFAGAWKNFEPLEEA